MPDQDDRQKASGESDASRESGEHPPFDSATHDKKTKKRRRNAKAQYWPAPQVARRITLILEAGLFVVGAIYSFFSYQQWKATADAAKAATASVQQARESAHIDQRSWIGAVAIDGTPSPNSRFKIDVTLKNTGKTFAKNVTVKSAILRSKNWKIPDFDALLKPIEPKGQGILAPDGEFHSVMTTPDNITEQELLDIEVGDVTLYIFGQTTYEDVFFCKHWTHFCFVLAGDREAGWKHNAYQSYNEADANCGPIPSN